MAGQVRHLPDCPAFAQWPIIHPGYFLQPIKIKLYFMIPMH